MSVVKETTYINLFGGPGSGKSTLAAELFSKYKKQGKSTELVTEVAKDFVWENRADTLAIQPYVSAKQYRNLKRLQGKVNYVITDAAILKDIIYGNHYDMPEAYTEFVKWMHQDLSPSVNILLIPSPEDQYQTEGRIHNYDESVKIYQEIKELLDSNQIKYSVHSRGQYNAN